MEPLQPSDPTTIGRYRITGRLGTGGMGSVYLGLSPGGRPAAVKIIHENFQTDPDSLARFRREVETLRTVRSAYTAALIDSEVRHAPYWLATEYVPGPTLHASVVDNGPFSTTACYGMLAALAEGLTDIHEHGVCHRDLKPQNVILAATGPQLIDFGIARGTEQTGLTQVGHAVGTPGYTAPEVLTHNQVGPAADVFALGVTIGFVATGRPPFGSGTFTAVSMRILDAKIDLGGVDAGLAALIRACVAADPADRPTPEAIIEACHRRSPVQPGPPASSGALAGRTSLMPAQPAQPGQPGQPGRGAASVPFPGRPMSGAAQVPGQPVTGAGQFPGRPVSGAAQVPGQPASQPMPTGTHGMGAQGMGGQGSGTHGMGGQARGAHGMGPQGRAGQRTSGTAQFPGQPVSQTMPMAGQGMGGQFGQGKASVQPPHQPTSLYPATSDHGGAYPGYSGSGSGSRPPANPAGPHTSGGTGRRSVILLSGLGVLIVVLLVVVLIRVGNGNDDPGQPTAAAAPTTAATTAPKADPTTERAAPPAPTTEPTTEPTPEKTEEQEKDDDDNISGSPVSDESGGLCAQMPKNAAPLDKVKLGNCTGKASQRWTYTSWSGLQQGDMCLDMGPDNEKPGENRTRVFPCNQSNTQQYKQNVDGTVYNPGTGLCLTIGDDDEGASMGMVDCDGAPSWHLPRKQN